MPSSVGPRQAVDNEAPPERDLHQKGWGYADTGFDFTENGNITLKGSRYPFSGMVFPQFLPWIERAVGIDINDRMEHTAKPAQDPPIRNEAFIAELSGISRHVSFTDSDRLFHGHGHTCQEVYALRYGRLHRVPDAVVWPTGHAEVERLVQLAIKHNVCLIPFGGGTSVSGALECPPDEKRMIVSVDMHRMNRILWVDKENLLVCMEAGIVGQDVKRRLEKLGLTLGHEPDSIEFSSLGGWIATRASGMRKNVYGNIDDLLIRVRMVTGVGTIDRAVEAPRVSMGPDVQQMVLGSEGTLGIITEAVLKVRPLPPETRYGSIAFPSFEAGVAFMREVALQRCAPASLRLVDNEQFQFGLALKPKATSPLAPVIEYLKRVYVTKIKGFEPSKICVATMVFEGTKEDIDVHYKKIMGLAAERGGIDGGPENGHRGYFLTFMIAYLRDFGMNYAFIAESFETSVPWTNVEALCSAVKDRIRAECKKAGVVREPFVSCRVTQTYDSGACVYFYFGFSWKGLADPVSTFTLVEEAARDEILLLGGSLSHHHGVGKHRRKWLPEQISESGVAVLQGVKAAVDPLNVFANSNLLPPPAANRSRL